MATGRSVYGRTRDGREVEIFTLDNGKGIRARVMTWGAILVSLEAPDRGGKPGEVTLGFDSLEPYLAPHPHFGATIGRFANRIAGGRFALDGREYRLALNEKGVSHLHGGNVGFDKVLWQGEPRGDSVELRYTSGDGEEGYPGTLEARASYALSADGVLTFEYRARTDKATPVNLTNHAYFNLAGGGDILGHVVQMHCSRYLPVDDKLIPTGQIRDVARDPDMDFRRPRAIGERIRQVGGYDHCYVIDASRESPAPVLRVSEPGSGRVMEVRSTQPGVQLYTGNFLDSSVKGRGGVPCLRHGAFCVETQAFPNAINEPRFPSCVLRPGQEYHHVTTFRFSAEVKAGAG
jgi:aldose 1-epimerase